MSLAGLATRDGAALLKQESTVNGQLIIEVSASTGGIHETLVADLELLVGILLWSVQLPAERALPNFYAAFAYGMGWTACMAWVVLHVSHSSQPSWHWRGGQESRCILVYDQLNGQLKTEPEGQSCELCAESSIARTTTAALDTGGVSAYSSVLTTAAS
jgi:hypothetical protein